MGRQAPLVGLIGSRAPPASICIDGSDGNGVHCASRAARAACKMPSRVAARVAAKYKTLRVLGRGAFGTALLVRSAPTATLAVLKRLSLAHMSQDERDAALNECKVLRKLRRHPNVITILEHFVDDRQLWIVMDYADSGDLAQRIEAQRSLGGEPFAEAQVLDWITQLSLALKHAHDRRVLHRDIKPQNIFLSGGHVRLGDFGISKVLGSTMSVASTWVGTPLYVAPEVCLGQDYDEGCDVWSLGVVAYELCALAPPFRAATMPALILRICDQEAPALPTERYSPELNHLVHAMLRKSPSSRPSIHEVLADGLVSERIGSFLEEEMLREEFACDFLDAPSAVNTEDARQWEGVAPGTPAPLPDDDIRGTTTAVEVPHPRSQQRADADRRRQEQRDQMRRDKRAAAAAAPSPSQFELVLPPASLDAPSLYGADAVSADNEEKALAVAPSVPLIAHRVHLYGRTIHDTAVEVHDDPGSGGGLESGPAEFEHDCGAVSGLDCGSAPESLHAPPGGQVSADDESCCDFEDRWDDFDGTRSSEAQLAEILDSWPAGRLLTEDEQTSAVASLEQQRVELASRLEGSTLSGDSGRRAFNDAHRRLLGISLLLEQLRRPHVFVLPPEAGVGLAALQRGAPSSVGLLSASGAVAMWEDDLLGDDTFEAPHADDATGAPDTSQTSSATWQSAGYEPHDVDAVSGGVAAPGAGQTNSATLRSLDDVASVDALSEGALTKSAAFASDGLISTASLATDTNTYGEVSARPVTRMSAGGVAFTVDFGSVPSPPRQPVQRWPKGEAFEVDFGSLPSPAQQPGQALRPWPKGEAFEV